MLRKVFVAVFIILGMYSHAEAQNLGSQIANAKFQAIKAAVEFLATDTGTFKKVTKTNCSGCSNFQDLKNFATTNKMTGVEKLIDHLKSRTIDTTAASANLKTFLAHVSDTLTSRKPERKGLKSFEKFSAVLETIEASLKIPPSGGGGMPCDTCNITPPPTDPVPPIEDSLTRYIAFGEAALLALLCFFMVKDAKKWKKKYVQQKNGHLKEIENLTKQLSNASSLLNTAETDLAELQKKLRRN